MDKIKGNQRRNHNGQIRDVKTVTNQTQIKANGNQFKKEPNNGRNQGKSETKSHWPN